MRLISQDGLKDVPYDEVYLSITDIVSVGGGHIKTNIYSYTTGVKICLAEYNDEEEGKAILKRIRESYTSNKTYFQFPPKESKEREENNGC